MVVAFLFVKRVHINIPLHLLLVANSSINLSDNLKERGIHIQINKS